MRFAYADPPYKGMAHRYEGGVEVNFPLLVAHLVDDFPDGWAMSCHTPSLRYLLDLCPPDVRIGAWTKPWAVFRPNVNPAYAWEPVIFHGGRKRTRADDTVRDWVSEGITFERGLVGVKPDEFCRWVFDLLGMEPEDGFVDIFPGSGAVTKAWEAWKAQPRLLRSEPASQALLDTSAERAERRIRGKRAPLVRSEP